MSIILAGGRFFLFHSKSSSKISLKPVSVKERNSIAKEKIRT